MYNTSGAVLQPDTYVVQLFSGSVFDQGPRIPLDTSEEMKLSDQGTWKTLRRQRDGTPKARMSVRVVKMNSDNAEFMDKLPQNLCGLLAEAPLLSAARELMFGLLVAKKKTAVSGSLFLYMEPQYSPELVLLLKLMDHPRTLQRLADSWHSTWKKASKKERVSVIILLNITYS